MYRNFFSLSDLPFSISPDPKYLFMSDRHKEALSHLTYGLGDVGGFALLTGEVGTGKTTVSRCVMEQLPDNTQAAFILNPTLSSQELLATLCDELGISYEKSDESLKHLTDKIAEKLLQNHENDINTLLIIDEAQHLQPEVLEQLRLLTNLETNTKKLLQVILIGQPELQQLLQRRDLRQLAQRITARYHLMPLTKVELQQYIEHRLAIADCVRPIFDKSAINKIHQLSQGVPRIINLLCHSALMQAYNQNDSVVNKKIVMIAAERSLGGDLTSKQSTAITYNQKLMLSTVISASAFIGLAGFWWGQQHDPSPVTASLNAKPAKSESSISGSVANIRSNDIRSEVTTSPIEPLPAEISLPQTQNTAYDVANQNVNKSDRKPATINQEMRAHNGVYTVQAGDTLFKVSVQFNVKLNTLRLWNNISPNNGIAIGDRLYVVEPSHFQNTQTRQVNTPSKQEELVVSAERPKPSTEIKYQVKPVAGVSNDLLALFQNAIEETEPEKPVNIEEKGNFTSIHEQLEDTASKLHSNIDGSNTLPSTDGTDILPLSQMPQSIQDALPSLKFEQHIYSSDRTGWVRESGSNYAEGDFISDRLKIDRILPQKVILSFDGYVFSVPALTSW